MPFTYGQQASAADARASVGVTELCIEEIASADDPGFAGLYSLYARLFPLPDEREPPEAFFEILRLNGHADIQRELGPWREIVLAVRSGAGGPVVGGHVFGVTTSRAHIDSGCGVSVQAIYTFFDRSVRGRTPMTQIECELRTRGLQVFDLADTPGIAPLIFFEVNNPLRMSARQIAEDTMNAGIDPHRRYSFWQRSGFSPLDFTYVQPRLRPDAKPVRYLDLFCNRDVASVSSRVVANHLRAFISISVLKGEPADSDPDFVAMRDQLTARDTVAFVPDSRDDQQAIHARARELASLSGSARSHHD